MHQELSFNHHLETTEMQNQIIYAFFVHPLATGLYYELSDDISIQSAGPVVPDSTCIGMNVMVDPFIEIEYKLVLKDGDGVIQNCKFSHSEGGIVIVDNLEIDVTENRCNPKSNTNQEAAKRDLTQSD